MENTSQSNNETNTISTYYYCNICKSRKTNVTDDCKCPNCNSELVKVTDNEDETRRLPQVEERPVQVFASWSPYNAFIIPMAKTFDDLEEVIYGHPNLGEGGQFRIADDYLQILRTNFEAQFGYLLAPMTDLEIERLPTTNISQNHLDVELQCTICLELFGMGEEVFKLNCDHMFHKNCLIPGIKIRSKCPFCRARILRERINSR